jgi:hypothetical protein
VPRDIKPSNLLLDTDGVLWVTDFGLAKAEDDGLTRTGDLIGTLRYMAPERFRGEAGACADLYALGLTLYELLTLQPAFEAPDRLTLIERIKGADPARPRSLDPRIPRDLETVVLKAIEKDAQARYPTAEALGEDLRRFLVDEPVKARRVSVAERYVRWARRNPLVATLGAVLTAVLCAVAAGALWAAAYFQEANRQSVIHRQAAELAHGEAVRERDGSQRLSAELALDRGIALAVAGDPARGLVWMLEAFKAAPEKAADLRRVTLQNLDAWFGQAHRPIKIVEQGWDG